MKIFMYWFNGNGLQHEFSVCKDEFDFKECDNKLWQLVKSGYIVTLSIEDE